MDDVTAMVEQPVETPSLPFPATDYDKNGIPTPVSQKRVYVLHTQQRAQHCFVHTMYSINIG